MSDHRPCSRVAGFVAVLAWVTLGATSHAQSDPLGSNPPPPPQVVESGGDVDEATKLGERPVRVQVWQSGPNGTLPLAAAPVTILDRELRETSGTTDGNGVADLSLHGACGWVSVKRAGVAPCNQLACGDLVTVTMHVSNTWLEQPTDLPPERWPVWADRFPAVDAALQACAVPDAGGGHDGRNVIRPGENGPLIVDTDGGRLPARTRACLMEAVRPLLDLDPVELEVRWRHAQLPGSLIVEDG